MATASFHIRANFIDGTRLDQIGEIIRERMKWMNESARDSIAATAVTILKSLRSATKVAKPSSIKVQVAPDNTLKPSYTTHSGGKRLCVRYIGSNERYMGKERLVAAARPEHVNAWHVYRFTDTLSKNLNSYIIVAPTQASAKGMAKRIVGSRQKRYAGLAKRALSVLSMKTVSQPIKDNVPQRVTQKAFELTSKKEALAKAKDGSGGKYSLTLNDDLRYAEYAIRGGRMQVDTQIKKAMNKVVSVINRSIPDGATFFGKKKLPTPFPEVRRRKK